MPICLKCIVIIQTNFVMSSDRNVEAETGFFIKNVTVVFMEKQIKLNLY
jgi:hypothetical protein